jgi:hypothetical protein
MVRTGKIDVAADPSQVSAKLQGNLSLYSDVCTLPYHAARQPVPVQLCMYPPLPSCKETCPCAVMHVPSLFTPKTAAAITSSQFVLGRVPCMAHTFIPTRCTVILPTR